MKFTQIDPKAPPVPAGGPQPSQEDILLQIEADYLVAKGKADEEEMARLDERHAAVLKAKTPAAANRAYRSTVEKQREPEPVPDTPGAEGE